MRNYYTYRNLWFFISRCSLYSSNFIICSCINFVVRLKSADDDMDVDVVGSGEESLNHSNVTNDEVISYPELQGEDEVDKRVAADAPGENSLTLEKLLQDLETSPQHDESDESGDEDFPFDDGYDDVEDEDELGDEERQDETIEDIEDNGEDTSRDATE